VRGCADVCVWGGESRFVMERCSQPDELDEDEAVDDLRIMLEGYIGDELEAAAASLPAAWKTLVAAAAEPAPDDASDFWGSDDECAAASPSPPAEAAAVRPASPSASSDASCESGKENAGAVAEDPGTALLAQVFPDADRRWLDEMVHAHDGDVAAAADAVQLARELEAAGCDVRHVRPKGSKAGGRRANKDATRGSATASSSPAPALDSALKSKIAAQYMVRDEEFVGRKSMHELSKADRAAYKTRLSGIATAIPDQDKNRPRIRYRDGKVASTKGEKYIVVTEPEPECMKATYVSLKKVRKGKRGPSPFAGGGSKGKKGPVSSNSAAGKKGKRK